jgi:hypothetical protein
MFFFLTMQLTQQSFKFDRREIRLIKRLEIFKMNINIYGEDRSKKLWRRKLVLFPMKPDVWTLL